MSADNIYLKLKNGTNEKCYKQKWYAIFLKHIKSVTRVLARASAIACTNWKT